MPEVPAAGLALDGRVAVVTGAAHGLGRAIAMTLARHGAVVWAGDTLAGEVEDTAALVRRAGGEAQARRVDVTQPGEVGAFITEAGGAGRLDIVVNNAGGVAGQTGRPVEEVTPAEWRAIVEINLEGAFNVCRSAVPRLKSSPCGRIVNISSGAGRAVSLTGIQAYAAAKAGLIGLTRQLAHELGPHGVTVNCVAPGFVLSNPTTERQWRSYGEDGQRALLKSIPLGRLGRPEEIADAVLFFVSDLAAWCTGQVLSVDGGKVMGA